MVTGIRPHTLLMPDEKFSEKGDILPSPVSMTPRSPTPGSPPLKVGTSKPRLSATVIIPIWIVLSSAVILYNNYVYNTLMFKYPVFLVTWHLVFAVRIS